MALGSVRPVTIPGSARQRVRLRYGPKASFVGPLPKLHPGSQGTAWRSSLSGLFSRVR